MKSVKVSIVITTYNLEAYVGQCLDSVLKQKTDFPFNVVVFDDCSSDRTVEILMRYQAQYPETIKVFPSDRNLGSLANSNRAFSGLTAKYFSFLDGDDYWLGEERLQEQYDFLEQNPDYVMCGGNTRYLVDGAEGDLVVTKPVGSFGYDDFMTGKGTFVHTSSILVRNVIFSQALPPVLEKSVGTSSECSFRGEDFRFRLHLQRGPIRVLDKTLSVYRVHRQGLWQGASPFRRNYEEARANLDFAHYFEQRYLGLHLDRSYQACLRCLGILRDLAVQRKGAPGVSPQEVQNLWEVMNRCLEHSDGIGKGACKTGFIERCLLRVHRFTKRKLEKRGLV